MANSGYRQLQVPAELTVLVQKLRIPPALKHAAWFRENVADVKRLPVIVPGLFTVVAETVPAEIVPVTLRLLYVGVELDETAVMSSFMTPAVTIWSTLEYSGQLAEYVVPS